MTWIALGKGTYGEDHRVSNNPFVLRGGVAATAAAIAYWLYQGFCAELITPAFVNASQTTGAGTVTTAEMGFFSTPNPPNHAGQTLTKIVAGSFTATGTGKKRNSSAFTTALTVPTHLWCGIRINTSVAPNGSFNGAQGDWQSGHMLFQSGSATFAAGSTFTGSLFAFADASPQMPYLYGSLE